MSVAEYLDATFFTDLRSFLTLWNKSGNIADIMKINALVNTHGL
jgi:hypothetical protein